MIELDDLTFAQLFWLFMGVVLIVFFACNLLNYFWVFYPLT
jgi:hypothetical protein